METKYLIKHSAARRKAERENPHRDWKYGLTPERIKELQDMGVNPDAVPEEKPEE